jgi:non-specific protein-tyrosine kinase
LDEKVTFKMTRNERNTPDLSEDFDINWMEYAYRFWRWAWLIAVAAMVAGGAAYFISTRITPVYQTTTLLLVSNPPSMSSIDSTAMIPSSTMTQAYSQMLTNTPVLSKVIENLGLVMSVETLKKAITIDVIIDAQIISVTVSDTHPTRAAAIANAIYQVFSDRILQLQADRYASTLDGLQKQVDDMSQQIDDTNAQINGETNQDMKLQLESRLTQYRQLYSSLVTNYEQVRLAEIQTSASVAQAEPAQIPTIQVSPKTALNTVMAAVLGMLLAISVVFATHALDDTIKNPEEIRQKFGLPVLGVIVQHTQLEGKPIAQEQPRLPVSESFRALRTAITYAAVDKPLRTIMVTSPSPLDGKTTICANLGVVFAQGGKKAVIVDGDLRRPMESERFGLVNASGLSDLFLQPLDLVDGSVQASGIPGLKVVTSGALPPNPAELMASKKMLEILERLNVENDLVLVDTPPALSVTDAVALAPGMDGVILVVKPGVTKLAAFKQTLELLQEVGAKILGVVLNDVEPGSRKYGYYYHRYYSQYSYYYTADGTKVERKKGKKETIQ